MAIGKLRALAIGVAALALAAPATAAAPSVVIEEVDRTRTLPAGDLAISTSSSTPRAQAARRHTPTRTAVSTVSRSTSPTGRRASRTRPPEARSARSSPAR